MNRWHYMNDCNGVRLWTDEQSAYGQFDVVDYADFEIFKSLCEKWSWQLVEHFA